MELRNESVRCGNTELQRPYWNLSRMFGAQRRFCRYFQAVNQFQQFELQANQAWAVCYVVFNTLGLLSAMLTLFTLCNNRRFSAVSYAYFRAVNLLELINNGALIVVNIVRLTDGGLDSRLSLWATRIMLAFANTAGTAIVLLTIFMSVERGLACFTPRTFSKVNKLTVAYTVCIFSLVTSIAVYLPSHFSFRVGDGKRQDDDYMVRRTAFGASRWYSYYTKFLEVMLLLISSAVIVSTAFALAGLVKAIKLKISLQKRTDADPSKKKTNKIPMSIRTNLQLCYLQLSQAFPISIDYTLAAVRSLVFGHDLFVGVFTSKVHQLTFERAMRHLALAYRQQYLIFAQNVFYELTHCFHFYMYVLLSRTFRRGLKEKLCLVKSNILDTLKTTNSHFANTAE